MNLQLANWGNSLALRIPSEVVRQLGLREGVPVEAHFTVDGTLSIRPGQWNRKAFAPDLTKARSAMPMSETVMEEVRSGAPAPLRLSKPKMPGSVSNAWWPPTSG